MEPTVLAGMQTEQVLMMGAGVLVGAVQKHWFTGKAWYRPNIPNSLIPFINTALGAIIGNLVGVGADAGAIAGIASVGAHQGIKIAAKTVKKPNIGGN
jgi:hypothetical protein